MLFERIASDLPHTPYAPYWNFIIAKSFFDDIDTKKLSKLILSKEKSIKNLPNSLDKNNKFTDGYTGLGKNSTTSKFLHYNVLNWNTTETEQLRKNIKLILLKYNNYNCNPTPEKVWVQCWANIMRFSQKINPHMHSVSPFSYLSGNFVVQSKDTSTFYINPVNQINDPEIFEIKNVDGEMTIFPSHVFHYTSRHYSIIPRITIAFDLSIDPRIENNKNFVLL